ncbi:MAG: hypothetical protein K9N55_19255 [Phycisphaerae bacterium]|nr:hypothetical protein [Phycisphaerae bacterium]
MKQNTKHLLTSESLIMWLWGVTILCLVLAGAYVLRYKDFLEVEVRLDPNSLIQTEPNEADLKGFVAEDQKLMEAMQTDNLFAKAPPKTNPVKDVDIIGQEALINGQLYKVGDKVGDAKIMAINADTVTVEWNGAQTTFSPINGQDQGGGASGSSNSSTPSGSRTRSGRNVARSGGGGRPSRMAPPTPEEINRIRSMSPEERRAYMEARRNSGR